jgi:hypothetical protein
MCVLFRRRKLKHKMKEGLKIFIFMNSIIYNNKIPFTFCSLTLMLFWFTDDEVDASLKWYCGTIS